jgi:hypothetical protein
MSSITQLAPTSNPPGRRPTRVRAQIPIRIRSLDLVPEFSEDGHTLVINPRGCGVRLRRSLEPGVRVLLDELPGGNRATASVANCVPLGSDSKYWLLGFALDKPGNIFCLSPAPADWGDQPVPISAVPLPRRANEWPYSVFAANGEAHPSRG